MVETSFGAKPKDKSKVEERTTFIIARSKMHKEH
jgi:hypothetical protein